MLDKLDHRRTKTTNYKQRTDLNVLIWLVFFLFFLLLSGCRGQTQPVQTATVSPTAPIMTPLPPVSTLTQTLTQTPTQTPMPIAPAWGNRTVVSLDGNWQAVKVKSLDDALPDSGWEKFQVPGTFNGYNYESAWFQRTFDVPTLWKGQRLILHFGGVKYNSRVMVNGKNVGGHFNGYDAFEIDINDAVKWGEPNLLQVGVHDWTGVFSDTSFNLQPYGSDTEALRVSPADRILSPIGGLFFDYGIWDSVMLKVVAEVHIDSFVVTASLKKDRLDVDITISNKGADSFTGALGGRIFPWYGAGRDNKGQWILQGEAVGNFLEQSVTLAAGETRILHLTVEHPNLKTWSPYTPQLYVLEIGFNQPGADAVRERFGWREFQVENGDFYLNGKKVHLLAASWWPDTSHWTREQIVTELENTRAANVVAFRTHTQPWSEIWYEVADEVGLMMIPEGAIWNDDISYRINDDRFWKNYADHLTAMVQTLRNHPSVVMWSLENELSGSRINDKTPVAEKHLADLGLLVKQLDSTRPITYESDGDPGGVTDVIGMHYPNEYPQYRLWPQNAYWLDKPREIGSGGGFFWDNQPFLWDHTKPLYIGEYMWEPSNDPSTHTVMMGDKAYISYRTYTVQAKAFAWRMQMLAYRYFGVSGHSPWTVQEEGALDESNPTWVTTRDMYRPLAAFPLDYDSRFFSGEKVARKIILFNDTMQDLPEVQFQWLLLDSKQILAQQTETLSMDSGSQAQRTIELPLPPSDMHKTLTFRLILSTDGDERYRDDIPIEIYPSRLKLSGAPFVLFDPQNRLSGTLLTDGVTFSRLNTLQDWDGQSILVLAPGALSQPGTANSTPVIGTKNSLGEWLSEKIQNGGRILALEQGPDTPSGTLPVKLSNQQSTLSFIQAPDHPILAGLTDTDLRWWRGDNLVSVNEISRPSFAGMQALIVTGNQSGISDAPLVEIHQGQGAWLLCQLQVASKLQEEPIAQVLFGRMLNYLASYQPAKGKVLYYPADLDVSSMKADWSLLQDWDELQYPAVRLLVLRGSTETVPLDQVKAFLDAGGTVVWDRPENDANPFLKSVGTNVQIQPWIGTVLRSEGKSSLLDFLAREDLYWIGTPGKNEHTESALAPNVSAIFAPESGSISTQGAIPAADGAKLTGTIVKAQKHEILMATYGTATWTVNIPRDGLYQFVLEAYGTPAAGIYPIAQVMLDDVSIGTIAIGSDTKQAYRLFFDGEAGTHQLSVIFTNDDYIPPEDRNLILSRYMIAPADNTGGAETLTNPIALVTMPVGKGNLVLSTIAWSDSGSNNLRGQRYFAGLLTGMGVNFTGTTAPVTIEAESLKPMPNFLYFDANSDHISMYTNGYVQGQVEIAQAGRYRIGIMGRGTPVDGIYPIIQIELNGNVIGKVELTGGGWEMHNISVDLPVGTFSLRLRFINDAWSPATGEDRNAWIDLIEFELEK